MNMTHSWQWRYGVAVLATAGAFFLRWLLAPLLAAVDRPFVLLTPAVCFSAWYGGLGAGLLTMALGALVVVNLFMSPTYPFAVADPTDMERLLVFLMEGVLLSCVCEALHRARRKAEAAAVALAQEAQERQKLEEALQQRAEELGQADRAKDQFLAMLAHELRNPLAPIRNAIELLKLQQGAAPEPHLIRAREIIERQVGHQARLIDDLLDVSRISRGKIRLSQEQIDLVRLVRDTGEDCRSVLEAAGLRLFLQLPEEPVWVEGDPTRLAQVVGNLLQNAAKFTDPGGRVTLQVVAEPEGQRATITVCDTGIGIEAAVLPHIFETFAQANRSLDRSRGGLGLGLALVKGLVELHGGAVQAESAGAGCGAVFTLRLPLYSGTGAPASPPPAAVTMGPLRILI
jgi:signal transduction histidine kinase